MKYMAVFIIFSLVGLGGICLNEHPFIKIFFNSDPFILIYAILWSLSGFAAIADGSHIGI